ncbi:hypothetical protein POJ06DRAFT_109887 [Lipomyces tetrasporus]|uniref:Uncharacterized protein n=1 Tax=Lipomyces tetrasporus TaxID=54092 RepID=A0AAD7QSH0_9ASCO|nr:uncharacterized protein POJ06DRAFT_109887 [Lipomyces tetrasporus]KAJ8100692.1 hypothetical protein POJ06DRAFT_109887 [Lipomyces tetrasporus]
MGTVARSVGVAVAVVLIIFLSFIISWRLRRVRHRTGPPIILSASDVTRSRRRRDHLAPRRRGTGDMVAIDLPPQHMQQELPQLNSNEQSLRGMTLPLYEQQMRNPVFPPPYEEAVQQGPKAICEGSGTSGQEDGQEIAGGASDVAYPDRALHRDMV